MRYFQHLPRRIHMIGAQALLLLLGGCNGANYVLYTHQDTSAANSANWGHFQIYRMWSNGWFQTNISNRNRSEMAADVRDDGSKVAIEVTGGGIQVMDIDGSNPVTIPNVPNTASWPRWSFGPINYFLVYCDVPSSIHAAIWRIQEDGSHQAQITHPGPNQSDQVADVVDNKHIVFDRFDSANNYRGDLYLKYIWDNRPPVQLTNTPNISESHPVVSHDHTMVAYLAYTSGASVVIHVARISVNSGLTPLYSFTLSPPASGTNVNGVDFSKNDGQLFISAMASDVPGTSINRKQEIFRTNLDGSNQTRLTNNSDWDAEPCAVP